MRVLIIYRHYWPDAPPLGDILKTLAEHLSARGHKVTVFTGYPDRKAARTTLPPREFKGGVRIVRARGPAGGGIVRRVVSEALFLAQAFAYAARHRFDLVWTDSLPPIVNGVVGIMAARASGARFLYHVHSVHPEALAITGLVTTPFVLRAWSRIDSWTCRRADAVVVLSEDMMRTIADRGGNGAVAFNVMRSFVLTPPAPSSGRTNPTPQPYRLAIYGSFGRGQDIDRLIAAMALIRPDEGIELEIIRMAGRQRDEDRRADELNLPHVRSTVPQTPGEVQQQLRAADAGVIALRRGIYRVGHPSKLMAYLAAGLPVLAMVETDSTLATYIEDHQLGIVADGDAAIVATAIRRLRDTLPATAKTRKRLIQLAERDFGRAPACARWAELVESLGTE